MNRKQIIATRCPLVAQRKISTINNNWGIKKADPKEVQIKPRGGIKMHASSMDK